MLTELVVDNFRGIRKAHLEGLRQFSILTGANNSGKSTVLEAAAIVAAAAADLNNQGLFDVLYTHRGGGNALDSLFFADAPKCDIGNGDIRVELQKHLLVVHRGEQRLAAMHIASPTRPTTFYLNDAVCYVAAEQSPNPGHLENSVSFAERNGHRKAIMEMVRFVDPSIVDLRILMADDERPVLYAATEIDGKEVVWPASLAGSGFKQLLTLVCKVAGATGLVCVDDPEAYLHPRLFEHVADILWRLVEQGAQVILSTHSVDLIAEIAARLNGGPESTQLGLYGLARDANGIMTLPVRRTGGAIQVPRKRDDLRELLGIRR